MTMDVKVSEKKLKFLKSIPKSRYIEAKLADFGMIKKDIPTRMEAMIASITTDLYNDALFIQYGAPNSPMIYIL